METFLYKQQKQKTQQKIIFYCYYFLDIVM